MQINKGWIAGLKTAYKIHAPPQKVVLNKEILLKNPLPTLLFKTIRFETPANNMRNENDMLNIFKIVHMLVSKKTLSAM